MATQKLTTFDGSSSLPTADYDFESGFAVNTASVFGAGFGANCLQYTNSGGGSSKVFLSVANDTLSGNCRVSSVFRGSGLASGQIAVNGVFFRASATTAATFLNGESYRVTVPTGPGATTISLIRRTAGTTDYNLGNLTVSSLTWAVDHNYEVWLGGNGAALTVEVQDLATGQWLAPSGTAWQSTRVACIAITDTTGLGGGGAPILTAGRYGSRVQVPTSATTVYVDWVRLSSLTNPTPTSSTVSGPVGATGSVGVTGVGTGGVTWASSNTGVATVNSSSGAYTLAGVGTCTFTATGNLDSREVATVDVTTTPTSANVSPSTATIDQFEVLGLIASNFTGGAVTWSSGTPSRATVNSSGLVTGVAHAQSSNQTSVITATGVSVPSETATMTVTVRAVSVTPSPSSSTLTVGDTLQLNPGVAGSLNHGATYASNNTGVATVNSSGVVTAVAAGTATITVTSAADTARSSAVAITAVAAPSTVYPSNWRLPAGVKIHGVNILTAAAFYPLYDLISAGATSEFGSAKGFSPTYWPQTLDIFEGNVEKAAALGMNAIRHWTAWPEACSDYGQPYTYYTAAEHAQHIRAFARVCAKYGMYFYPTAGVGYVYNSPPLLTNNQMANWIGVLVTALAGEPNVLGIDLMNEALGVGGSYLTDANAIALVNASHAADPTLPATISCVNRNSASQWTAFPIDRATTAGVDFLDGHGYWDMVPSDFDTFEGLTSKPYFLGEIGSATGFSQLPARWLAAGDLVLQKNAAGAFVWSMNGGNTSAAYNAIGAESVASDGTRVIGYAPKPPVKAPIVHRFYPAFGGDYRYRSYSGPGYTSGFVQAGYNGTSNTLVSQAGQADGYQANSTATEAVNYLSDTPASRDFTLASTFRTLVADGTQPHTGGVVFGAEVFAAQPTRYFAGYSNAAGAWVIQSSASGATTTLGSGGSAPSVGRTNFLLTVSGGGTTATLAVGGTTVVGPVTLPRTIKPGRRIGFLLSGAGTDPLTALDMVLTPTYPVTAETLALSSVGSTSANLAVSGGSGVVSRQWHRYPIPGTPLSSKTLVSGQTGTTLSQTGMTTGLPYYYRVRSQDGAGNFQLSNEMLAVPSGTGASASSYGVYGIPANAVVGTTYAVNVILNGAASASGTITPTPATGITWGSPVAIAQGATAGSTTATFTAANTYTPAFTHTGLGFAGEFTHGQVVATAVPAATGFAVIGLPPGPVVGTTYTIGVVLDGPATASGVVTFGAQSGITWGGTVSIAQDATSGTTTATFTAAGTYTPTVSHTGLGFSPNPTLQQVTAVTGSGGGSAPTASENAAAVLAAFNAAPPAVRLVAIGTADADGIRAADELREEYLLDPEPLREEFAASVAARTTTEVVDDLGVVKLGTGSVVATPAPGPTTFSANLAGVAIPSNGFRGANVLFQLNSSGAATQLTGVKRTVVSYQLVGSRGDFTLDPENPLPVAPSVGHTFLLG